MDYICKPKMYIIFLYLLSYLKESFKKYLDPIFEEDIDKTEVRSFVIMHVIYLKVN